jgi:formylglycine-generating enzyme
MMGSMRWVWPVVGSLVVLDVGACTLLTSKDGLTGGEGGGAGGGSADCPPPPVCSDAGPDTDAQPPSCIGLHETCAGQCNCCDSVLVPGGDFWMGRGEAHAGDDSPEHSVNVPTFRLDRFEVTVGRFKKFVAALAVDGASIITGQANPVVGADGWNQDWNEFLDAGVLADADSYERTWDAAAPEGESYAVNWVNWYMAYAFCIWDGGWLPSESEWEYAATGGLANRLYPWGDAPPDGRAVFDVHCPDTGCTPQDWGPVGSRPAGKGCFGQLDLAGGMGELVWDSFSATWYVERPNTGAFPDNINRADAGLHTLRGGSFFQDDTRLPSTARYGWPDFGDAGGPRSDIGFRCARRQ